MLSDAYFGYCPTDRIRPFLGWREKRVCMKTEAVCAECMRIHPLLALQSDEVEFYDDGVALVECRFGHKTAVIVQSSKTEILLSSAADALSRGFTFEAVASAAAALERFYEFSLRVFFNSKGKSTEHFKAFFNGMSSQSERQLGAFMLFHEFELGTPFNPRLDMTTFRNSVIHKGKIPTIMESEKYCGYVYETVRAIHDKLIARYPSDVIIQTVADGMKEKWQRVPKGMRHSTAGGFNLLNLVSDTNKPTFSEAMQAFAEAREAMTQGRKALSAIIDGVVGAP
jgi:hypothetical protein